MKTKINDFITVEDLMEWENDNHEDVIIDGPYELTDEQEELFVSNVKNDTELSDFIKANNEIDDIENIYDIGVIIDGGMTESEEEIAMKYKEILFGLFADVLNG